MRGGCKCKRGRETPTQDCNHKGYHKLSATVNSSQQSRSSVAGNNSSSDRNDPGVRITAASSCTGSGTESFFDSHRVSQNFEGATFNSGENSGQQIVNWTNSWDRKSSGTEFSFNSSGSQNFKGAVIKSGGKSGTVELMEKGKSCKYTDKAKSDLKWTKDMDCVLTSVLVEQHNSGNQVPNGWKPVAYTAAINGIKEQCNVVITKANIVSRLKTWSKHFAVIINMLGSSGFGWDWEHNRVKVDSDQVWKDYIKSHPEASIYRYKEIENWEDLTIICGHDRATGDGAETGAEDMKEIEQEENANKETIYDAPESTPNSAKQPTSSILSTNLQRKRNCSGDTRYDAPESTPNSTKQPTSSILSTNLQRKRNCSGDTRAIAVTHMANTYPSEPIKASAEEIFAELSKISDLEESELLRAYDVLTGDARKYESFKALPAMHRKSWILMQIKKR